MSLQGWQQKADTYVASPYVLSMVLGALVCLFFRVEVTGAEPNSLMRTSQLKLWVLEEGRVRGTVARSVREATVVAAQLGKGISGVNGTRFERH